MQENRNKLAATEEILLMLTPSSFVEIKKTFEYSSDTWVSVEAKKNYTQGCDEGD